ARPVQRHHVVIAADVGVADEDLRHRCPAGARHHPRTLGGVEVDPHLGPFQALAAQEVLGGHAVGAHRAGVEGDFGGSVLVQDDLRKLVAPQRSIAIFADPARRVVHAPQRPATTARINGVFTPAVRVAPILSATLPRSPPIRSRMRLLPATIALVLAVAVSAAPAQQRLPDIGSSADTMLGPAQQREYGQMLLAQLRHYDYILDDPLIDSWLRHMGNRLAEASDQPEQPFTFFMIKDRSVNAF